MVDSIRIGEHGFALVVAPDGALIAHGDPDKKALVAQARNMSGHPLVAAARRRGDPPSAEYVDDERPRAARASRRASRRSAGRVIVEQPTERGLRQRHGSCSGSSIVAIAVALLRHDRRRPPVRPAVHHADLHAEARRRRPWPPASSTPASTSARGDEFGELGDAFNTMADRLVELQEDVKRQERQAMFGRVAAGLVHDLSHPIQNIGNSTRLLLRDDLDAESREMFQRHDRARARDAASASWTTCATSSSRSRSSASRWTSTRRSPRSSTRCGPKASGTASPSRRATPTDPLVIDGDRFALGRVYRNLITNAIQATAAGRPRRRSRRRAPAIACEITVTDTGSGIPPDRLSAIFDDFVTTKRRGLGLGLAISKRIVEQLDGTITVESEVGRGTTFTLRFPARDDRSAQAAAS